MRLLGRGRRIRKGPSRRQLGNYRFLVGKIRRRLDCPSGGEMDRLIRNAHGSDLRQISRMPA